MSAPVMPVILAALLNMQTTLQGITRANGYFNDIKATSVVLDPTSLEQVPDTELPFIVLDVEENGINGYSGISKPNAIKRDWTVPLRAMLIAPDTDSSAKRRAAWQFYADVETALAVDPQRGQTVMYTYVQWPSAIACGLPSQRKVYVEIPIAFKAHQDYGRP